MDLDTLIVTVFTVIDDMMPLVLGGRRLRSRGPQPRLTDAEVLTMEVVGEYLGLEHDTAIFGYFRRHFAHFFPAVRQVHRTTFARQAANLWRVKEGLWHAVADQVCHDPGLSIIDSFPVPVCRFARAARCRRLREQATFGYDALAKQTFFGLRAHLRIGWPGVIVACELTPAHVHDLVAAPEVLETAQGYLLGDRNYWSPEFRAAWRQRGLAVLTPYRSARHDPQPWPRWLVNTRRRIETVIGQLVERFHAKRVWARDRWHFCARWLRKLLSHTLGMYLCQQHGLPPLRLAELLTN